MAINTEYLSGHTTDFTSSVSIAGATAMGGALESASAISAAAIAATTIDLNTGASVVAAPISTLTAASANDMTIGQLRFVFTSSGLSVIYSSGVSIYDVGSNTSAAQPTS